MLKRNRRLRQSPTIRALIGENQLSINDLILPIFVCEGTKVKESIEGMPGCFRMSLDLLKEEVNTVWSLGIKLSLIHISEPTRPY